MASNFGTLLQRLRVAAGFSQEALAEAARISTSAIGAYERGVHSAPHRDTVELLIQALQLDENDRAEFQRRARRRPRRVSSSPPTASLTETLPHDATSFVGREADVAVVIELILGHRCVTLTGIGGIGKRA
jgi:transcriptional regulator with XRE-family HTH domain